MMKFMHYAILPLVWGCFALIGCATMYHPMETPVWPATIAKYPTTDSSARKIVFINFSDGGQPDAKAANAARTLEQEIKGLVSSTAEIIDRSVVEGLRDEIIQLENQGISTYTTTLATDAISAEVSGVDIRSSFSPATSNTNNGQTYRTPAQCNYTIEARVLIQLYEFRPKLHRSEAISAVGTTKGNIKTSASSCPIPQATRNGWVNAAIGDAIRGRKASARKELMTAFATSGAVRQVRMDEGARGPGLVWITLSAGQGARVGADIFIFSNQEQSVYDVDSGRTVTEIVSVEVANGVVVDSTDLNNTWVKVKDGSSVKKINLGDRATIHYEDKCTFTDLLSCLEQ